MYQYSTVVKLPPLEDKEMQEYISNRIEAWLKGIGVSKRVLVHKEQVKGGIKFELNAIKFFRDYTEASISIGNMNPDAEVRLLENDTTAFQNSKRFTVNEVVRYQIRDTPYIKPKISPSATFPRPTGIVRFKPLDHSKDKAKFKFNINKKTQDNYQDQDNYDFTFDVSLEQSTLCPWR